MTTMKEAIQGVTSCELCGVEITPEPSLSFIANPRFCHRCQKIINAEVGRMVGVWLDEQLAAVEDEGK